MNDHINIEEHGDPARPGQGSWAWWLIGLSIFAIAGTLATYSAAEVADAERRQDREVFERSASEVAGSLERSIERHEDLVVSAGAQVQANPAITSSELRRWLDAVRATQRYPELMAVGLITVVTPGQLDEFAALHADASAGALGGDFAVMPPGERDFYCLLQATISYGSEMPAIPAGLDYCAGDFGLGAMPQTIRDEGHASYLALDLAGQAHLIVQTPIYTGPVVPGSVAQRRTQYLGNLGLIIAPDRVLASVLSGYPELSLRLAYRSATQSINFDAGAAVARPELITVDLGDGWIAELARPQQQSSLVANRAAVLILISGLIASMLLAGLVVILGTSRQRARRQLAERTADLHHQAAHDALTGLPNRTTIVARARALIERCHRRSTTAVALFIDLDQFKAINDTLGHAAGDQVLEQVADRMRRVLAVDTIGRLGGDEFIVLIESRRSAEADQVAAAILDSLSDPFIVEVDGCRHLVTTTASIGVTSDGDSTAELLRTADLALYDAKAAGRNCHRWYGRSATPASEIDRRQEDAVAIPATSHDLPPAPERTVRSVAEVTT